MDAAQAISSVVEWLGAHESDYPADDLRAAPFQGGWCVYAPDMIAEEPSVPLDTRSVFLVGESGRVKEITSGKPVEQARQWFEEACIWFSAEEPPHLELDDSLPSHPDLGGSSRRRAAADYDRTAVDVLARALAGEPDFADWLRGRLRDLADLLGGESRLIARRPNSWAARQLAELAQPLAEDQGRPVVWEDWPPVDPVRLPDVDTAGWLLTPCVAACQYMEDLEPESEAAGRMADVLADRAEHAPPWHACGVAELEPKFVALRRTEQIDADLQALRALTAADGADEDLDTAFLAPGDRDVDALLRIAIDAEQRHREVVAIDAAATAAYRRVLDRTGLPFDNYAYEAMFG